MSYDYNRFILEMRFIFTKHAIEKFDQLERLGWVVTKDKIRRTIKKPKWTGVSRHGQKTAMSLVDQKHIIRVVFNKEDDIIKIITFHIARRGKYESTL